MAQFPILPIWTDAYIADTQHLTNEEHGVYLRLLMFAWRTVECALPDDDRRLALMVGVTAKKWAALKPVVMKFWMLSEGAWTQKKLTAEREKVERTREQKVAAGFASSRSKGLKNNDRASTAVVQPLPTAHPTADQLSISISTEEDKSSSLLSETSSDQAAKSRKRSSYPDAFESFWLIYPTTANMSKKEAFDAWKKLDVEDREKCARAVGAYRAYLRGKPDLEVIHACRFISKRRFDGFADVGLKLVEAVSEETWVVRLRRARKIAQWSSAEWGPSPGTDGCRVPSHLLDPADGSGWTEMVVAA